MRATPHPAPARSACPGEGDSAAWRPRRLAKEGQAPDQAPRRPRPRTALPPPLLGAVLLWKSIRAEAPTSHSTSVLPFRSCGGAHRGQNTLTQTRPSKLCASSLRDPGSPYKSATGGNTGAPRPRPLPFLHTGGCWYYTWFFSRCLCNLTRRRACSLDATAASQLRPGGVGTSAFLAPGTRSPRLTPRWALEGKQSVQPTRHLLPTVCVRARFGYRLVRIWIPPTRRPAGAGGCSAAGPRAGAHPPALGGPDIPVPPASEGNPNAPDPWRRAETLLGLHQGHKIMPEFS